MKVLFISFNLNYHTLGFLCTLKFKNHYVKYKQYCMKGHVFCNSMWAFGSISNFQTSKTGVNSFLQITLHNLPVKLTSWVHRNAFVSAVLLFWEGWTETGYDGKQIKEKMPCMAVFCKHFGPSQHMPIVWGQVIQSTIKAWVKLQFEEWNQITIKKACLVHDILVRL